MDTLLSSWLVLCGCLTAIAIGVAAFARHHAHRPRSAPRRETPTVALVRRRRELMSRLHELAGDGGNQLIQTEARRRGASPLDFDVLEAAIERAGRDSAQGELQAARR